MEYDDIIPIGIDECCFVKGATEMLEYLGVKKSFYDICKKLNYPKYALDCMRTYEGTNDFLKDKDIYENYIDSWIHLYSNLTLERRDSKKLKSIRTFSATCRDLVCNDIVETFLVSELNKHTNDFVIISNDEKDENGSFQIYKNATTKPDFKLIIDGKEYLLELKCTNEKKIGFKDDKFINNISDYSHYRYKEYKKNLYFLKIDIFHKKCAIFSYNELDKSEISLENINVGDFSNDKIYDTIKEIILKKFK